MSTLTYRDLGLPSIGEFTLTNMRAHRHEVVRTLGGFLSNKLDYLGNDRFTVRYILYLAQFVQVGVHPAYACRRIQIGSRPSSTSLRSRATRAFQYSPDDVPLYPWEVTYVLPRQEAIEAWSRRRYGRRESQRLSPHLQQQHFTFDLEA